MQIDNNSGMSTPDEAGGRLGSLTEPHGFEGDALRYRMLIPREDYLGTLTPALQSLIHGDHLEACDLGTGTGRLASILAPRARSMVALDVSGAMLALARRMLVPLYPAGALTIAAADHRNLPLGTGTMDLLVSGWSVSYLVLWNPRTWQSQLDRWMDEASRVLRPGGQLALVESLGTGESRPKELPHLGGYYAWLAEQGFRRRWVRTDYRFETMEEATELVGAFFGADLQVRMRAGGSLVLPECTGIWWRRAQGAPELTG